MGSKPYSREQSLANTRNLLKSVLRYISQPRKQATYFSTEEFLYVCANDYLEVKDDQVWNKLDILCKKTEVNRLLLAYYKLDLTNPTHVEHIQPEYVALFVIILMHYADYYSDAKYLNTALKTLDGCLQQEYPKLPNCLHVWAEQVLHQICSK